MGMTVQGGMRMIAAWAVWGLCAALSAQGLMFGDYDGGGQSERAEQTPAGVVRFSLRGYRRGGDTVGVEMDRAVRDYLSGGFFKQLSDSVLIHK